MLKLAKHTVGVLDLSENDRMHEATQLISTNSLFTFIYFLWLCDCAYLQLKQSTTLIEDATHPPTQLLFENLKNIWISIEVVYLKMSFSLLCLMHCACKGLQFVCVYMLETLLDTATDCCFNSVLHCCCSPGIGLWRAHPCCSLASWSVFPGCRWTSRTSTTSYPSAEQEALCLQDIVKIK